MKITELCISSEWTQDFKQRQDKYKLYEKLRVYLVWKSKEAKFGTGLNRKKYIGMVQIKTQKPSFFYPSVYIHYSTNAGRDFNTMVSVF